MSAEARPTVQEAWANVMAEVRELGKDRRTDSGARFNFRGVDDVMNAVGPVLRKHGVSVVPTAVNHIPETYATKSGTAMRNVTVVVSYAIHGPAGDTMSGAAAGEAADAGDKATPKAMSVAYRTFLLQSLCLPTGDRDPDMDQHERAAGPSDEERAQQEAAQAYANGLATCTDPAVLEGVRQRAEAEGLLAKTVTYRGAQGILAAAFGARQRELAQPHATTNGQAVPA